MVEFARYDDLPNRITKQVSPTAFLQFPPVQSIFVIAGL
jgi:hypothetical protein